MIWIRDFAAIAVIMGLASGAMVIVLNDRRWMLFMLAIEYVAMTWLVAVALPLTVAAVKMVAGLMACAVMALTILRSGYTSHALEREGLPSGMVFRVIAVLLVSTSAWGLAERGWMFLPGAVSRAATVGALILLGMGLLHLGISEEPFRVGMALLTTLAGFEIIYAAVEPSLAVLALMGAMHIGIAIIVSYLVVGAELQDSGGGT